jgi:protein-S-isoprenylcysteine O-methyltransferase Ste14
MSFKLGLDNVQQVLMLALMLVFFFAIFYSNMEWTYKLGIAALVFTMIFLLSLAGQLLRQQDEARKRF